MTTLEHIEAMNQVFNNMTEEQIEEYKQSIIDSSPVSKKDFNALLKEIEMLKSEVRRLELLIN